MGGISQKIVPSESGLHVILNALMEIIPILDHLENLEMELLPPFEYYSAGILENFFSSIWKCLRAASQLKCLHLLCHIPDINLIVPPKYIFWEVQELHLSLSCNSGSIRLLDTELLVPFLNTLSSHLRTFTVESHNIDGICHIFQDSKQFTRLENLWLGLAHDLPGPSQLDRIYHSIQHFLSKHTANLTSLSVHSSSFGHSTLEHTPILSSCVPDELALRNLRILNLDPVLISLTYIQALELMLSQCQDVLEVFTFTYFCNSDTILQIIGFLRNCSRLSRLTLSIKGISLDSWLFDILSVLQSLRSLTLRCYYEPRNLSALTLSDEELSDELVRLNTSMFHRRF
ncbi:hypothetical protein BDQ17DRAFT_1348317 [Cyathus striatus]|nr:hypothetical protein BDQ17DRAFT_1348317 [Cyathus striatus]